MSYSKLSIKAYGKRHVALFLTIKMALLLTIKIKDSNFILYVRMIQVGSEKKQKESLQLQRSQSSQFLFTLVQTFIVAFAQRSPAG